jgi:hypothetical protein
MRILRHLSKRQSARTRRMMVIALIGFSALSTLAGMRTLIAFDQTAGAAGAVPLRWPERTAIGRSGRRPELLVFAHPFCSCTAATLAELAHLSVQRKPGADSPAITILFFRPRNSGWAPNGLWNQARSLADAHAVWDDDGHEAQRFGARTSGHALLYSSSGDLLFSGGVTGSRGHQGDNYGLDRLVAALDSGRLAHTSSASLSGPVFGCALGGSDGSR